MAKITQVSHLFPLKESQQMQCLIFNAWGWHEQHVHSTGLDVIRLIVQDPISRKLHLSHKVHFQKLSPRVPRLCGHLLLLHWPEGRSGFCRSPFCEQHRQNPEERLGFLSRWLRYPGKQNSATTETLIRHLMHFISFTVIPCDSSRPSHQQTLFQRSSSPQPIRK